MTFADKLFALWQAGLNLAGDNFILGVCENTDSKLVLVVLIISLFEMLGDPKYGRFVTYPETLPGLSFYLLHTVGSGAGVVGRGILHWYCSELLENYDHSNAFSTSKKNKSALSN